MSKLRVQLILSAVVVIAATANITAQSTVTASDTTSSATVPVFNGGSTVTNSPITVSGSNVGIGTTVPIRALTVYGETSIVPNAVNGTYAQLNVSDTTGSNGGNYSLNIRGLGNSGTAGVNLA